jgi:hypothetical protein
LGQDFQKESKEGKKEMNYTPGEGYDKGFQCRMNGGAKPQQAQIALNPYWEEYATGWNDADTKILAEARARNGLLNEHGKQFLQD